MLKDELIEENEERDLQIGIEYLVANSGSFAFLREEEDLYTLEDLKEKY